MTVRGQRYWLDGHCADGHGVVEITGARVYWWIVDDNATAGEYYFRGHIATLYQNEIYGMVTGRSRVGLIQQFGVVVGYQRVVIYVEPTDQGISPNTTRTELRLNGEDLPWDRWAAEFRAKFPRELKQLIDRINARAEARDHAKSIRERLKGVYRFRLAPYRADPAGGDPIGSGIEPGTPATAGSPAAGGSSGGSRSPSPDPLAKLRKKGDTDEKGTKQKRDAFPTCRWVSAEEGSREPGVIEDRAARYLHEQNLIQINADFRGYHSIMKYWQEQYQGIEGAEVTIRETVREWLEQALTEAVLAVKQLDGPEWTSDTTERALSEEALTTVFVARYHTQNAVAKSLGTKLGRRQEVVAC